MTLPDERRRAVILTKLFLMDLITPAKTPKVSLSVRKRAIALLRHYPGECDMAEVQRAFGPDPQ